MSRLLRLLLVGAGLLGFALFHPDPWATPLWVVAVLFVFLVGLVVVASFGVLREANLLSARVGEPYGSLILTVSVLIIEIVLIAAVMLGSTPAPQIGRDSVYSVMMIIVNLVLGLAILVATLGKAHHQAPKVPSLPALIYLALIGVFGGLAFFGPYLFTPFTGGFPLPWSFVVALVVAASYAGFLSLQMGRWRRLFAEPHSQSASSDTEPGSVLAAVTFLVLFLVAVALLGENLAVFIDYSVSGLGLPQALGGLVIAALVFTPETLTTLSAARSGQVQRVINLCLGAFVSTVGMTFPAVVVLGQLTGTGAVFALAPLDGALFVATLALSWLTFSRRRLSSTLGAAHVTLFAVFGATLVFA